MEYTRNIVLDVNAVSAAAVVKAKQGDNSTRFINITLHRDGIPVTPEEGATVQFRLEKPDRHAVLNSGTINTDGSVTVELTGQCTAVPGRATADISVMKDGKCLSSAVFYLDVLEAPDIANRTASSDEFGLLDEAIAKAEAAFQDVDEAIGEMQQATQEAIDEMEETMQKAFKKRMTVSVSGTWEGTGPYTQTLSLTGYTVTENTLVDLVGSASVIERMETDGVSRLYVENDDGVLTVYAFDAAPTQPFSADIYISELINE